ncbi:hypothetical protein PG991_014228 [Apiospora marii]|uniref:Zinc transporter n=1 Tax=Apiospora marii TaxID=335849 RepID=A0ABR1R895_9PEZI
MAPGSRPKPIQVPPPYSSHHQGIAAAVARTPRRANDDSTTSNYYDNDYDGELSFYDANRLSPVAPTFHQDSALLSPTYAPSAMSSRPSSAAANSPFMKENTPPVDIPVAASAAASNPFNFQTQIISTSPVKPNVGQRRGHRYKHSSISTQHQIFQEPPPRPPLALPRDLPIPTLREAWKSTSKDQRGRLYWCLCHFVVAVGVFLSAHGSLAMTALSHLVFFDVGSAAVCVVVEVLGNFEVWKRSSIRHPFGLERAEVLAGFAMSVFLIFGGFDLVSHNLKHVLEGLGDHEAHHPDHHGGTGESPRVEHGSVDLTSLAAIIATLVSAYGLRNHGRISRIMRVSYLSSLPSVLSNPFHFLTLSTSFILLMLPLLSIPMSILLDGALCGLVAVSMFGLGVRLAVAQGLMLLMSYGGRSVSTSSGKSRDIGVSDVVSEIAAEPNVERVEEAQFWQVHYGLCMANLKLCVARGADDGALSRLRTRISTLVQNRLGEGYGKGNSLRWEVSLQTSTESKTSL